MVERLPMWATLGAIPIKQKAMPVFVYPNMTQLTREVDNTHDKVGPPIM